MITKKNYFSCVCIVYSILVIGKLVMESLLGKTDQFYTENLLYMFIVCAVATLILSLHQFVPGIPLLFVIILQYLLLVLFIMISMYFMNFISPLEEGGYFEMFRSISIPYFVIAAIYYISYFREIKMANQSLKDIKDN